MQPGPRPNLPPMLHRPDAGVQFVRFMWVNMALLGASAVANVVIDRPLFALVHVLMLLAVLIAVGVKVRWGWSLAKRWYLIALMPYLVSFAYLGELESFDILWMLMYPPIAAFLVKHPANLVRWDASFLALVLVVYSLHWTRVLPLDYSDLALGAQFTALLFLAILSWFMQGYKARFDRMQDSFQSQLETAVDDGLAEINSLNDELERTQGTLVRLLGELCEARSKETGDHVGRVAAYSRRLAELAGLPKESRQLIHRASPLHDVGKVAVPDAILNKPGRLTDEEFGVIKEHTSRGHQILSQQERPLLRVAAIIAHEHHERWDGNGYPRGLAGTDISIEGRVVAIADVFDALSFERAYKPAWEDERIRELFTSERGRHFDPELTDLFLGHYADFVALRDRVG
ncbi:MAG: HD-GYP domain-containing protein [Guyparkeria sp.]